MLPRARCSPNGRGNHESTGDWFFGQTGFDRDEDDISVVARHLIDTYGYVVKLVVAHSRATGPAMRWVSLAPEAKNVAGYVNVSSRYRMEVSCTACEPAHDGLMICSGCVVLW